MRIHDLTFTEIEIEQPVTRVISIVPSVTETLFALGKGGTLVGRTVFCTEPKGEVESVDTVGGTKSPNVKKIIELDPQLVLANKEENRREDIEALRKAGLTVHVAQPTTVEEGLSYVTTCGRIFEVEDRAEEITRAGVKELVRIQERIRELKEHNELRVNPRPYVYPRVVCFVWNDPWMVVGTQTYIGDMIEVLGGDHRLKQSTDRYFKMDPTDVAALNPDIMLFPDEPYAFTEDDLQFWRDNFEDIPAVRDNRLRICDGQDLCWFGARIPRALRNLQPVMSW